jgi:hypothetical protein
VLLTSDSSDSEEDRSGTSDGIWPTGSDTAAGGALADSAKAWGWSDAPCAVARADLRLFEERHSPEGV